MSKIRSKLTLDFFDSKVKTFLFWATFILFIVGLFLQFPLIDMAALLLYHAVLVSPHYNKNADFITVVNQSLFMFNALLTSINYGYW